MLKLKVQNLISLSMQKSQLLNLHKRPPTPDPEWNTRQVVDDQPEHNNMEYAAKNPLTFDDIVAHSYLISTRDRCPFDLNKPLPLKGRPCHLTVALEYFFNNDLEYLKSSDPDKKYTTSIIKTKAARYELVGIEDMIPSLYSVTKVGYDKDTERGIKHWGAKHRLFYRSQLNKLSKHDGYSHMKILNVKGVKIKEGDFVNLHLNDIEDMLLLVVQHKLFQLNGSEIVDLAVALRMFTKSLIIKRRVEDVQLGVESYQKKLNIIKPQEDFPGISVKELIQQRNVRRKWSATDKRRSELMVELIDKQMRERRILRNLERLVGDRELKMDYRLMHMTL
ncbi:hypothetical protein Tco_0640724 [Tanacetum coccineum]